MELAAALAAGIIFGAIAAGMVHREELGYLRTELKVAHAQIAHAVIEEKAQIPMRLEEAPEQKPLTKELQDCVDQWEGAESQAVEESRIRGYLHEGRGIDAIKRQYGL